MNTDNSDTMNKSPRKYVPQNRPFFLTVTKEQENNLKYFVKQELSYYNLVVEQLTSRVKAFPQDIMSIKDREVKLLETCAQYGIDVEKLTTTPVEKWPDTVKSYQQVIFDQNGKKALDSRHIGIMKIGSGPGHLPSSVRRGIVSEAFSYVNNQASIILASQKSESGVLKAPLQMLQTQTLETKRHLQLPKSAIEMTYVEDKNQTHIKTPYSKTPLIVENYDLTGLTYNYIVIRSPIQNEQKWVLEFKDNSKYMLNLLDPRPRKQRVRR